MSVITPALGASAAQLLDAAADLWVRARVQYRDHMLEVGGLLTDFLVARAAETEGLSSKQMLARNQSREKAVLEAARRLKVKRDTVYSLLVATQVAHILGLGDPGSLSYSALLAFRRLVIRKTAHDSKSYLPADSLGEHRLARESWDVSPLTRTSPRELFALARRESWTTEQIRVRLKREYLNQPPAGRVKDDSSDEGPSLAQVVKVGNPHDVADLLLSLIRESHDPAGLARALAQRLNALPR